MKKLVVCRVCGYVMGADKVGDKCPACGVPAKAFQEYTPAMKPKRELWLSFDLHPVLVHFPVAFSITIFFIALVFAVSAGYLRETLGSALSVTAVILPFVVAAGAVSGILDGNVRFKKVNTPLLIRKIILGSLFFAASVAMIVLVLASSLDNLGTWIAFLVCDAGAIACAAFLGLIGKTLVCARTPG